MRKDLLLPFLMVGLTGTLAAPAPAPNAAPDFALEAGYPCPILCTIGKHAVYNPKTKRCECVPDITKEICLLATTCLEGSHPFWNLTTNKCSCNSNDAEFICKAATTCSPGSVPIWHAVTEECICKKVFKRQDDIPDPKTCPTIRCAKGYLPKWVPEKRHCICEKIPRNTPTTKRDEADIAERRSLDPSTCPTIKCRAGYLPIYNPKTKACSCQLDQSTCPTIKCGNRYFPVYSPKTNTCGCQKDPCATTICISEKHGVYNSTSKQCECEWIPGFEPKCEGWMCIAEKTPVYNPETGKCGCQWIPGLEPKPVDPCEGIFCIAEKTPKVNVTTGVCECEWIPGLEPTNIKREPEPQITGPVNPPTESCTGTICISEMHGVWNATSQRCECEWIPGLQPGSLATVKEREPEPRITSSPHSLPTLLPGKSCGKTICISEMHGVWNATSQRCECEWIKGFGPGEPVTIKKREPQPVALPDGTPSLGTPTRTIISPNPTNTDPLGCYLRRIYCEGGDHHQHYDPITMTCKCPPVITKPTPTPTPVTLPCEALNVYCGYGDHYMHFDEKCGCCKCPDKGT